MNVFKPIHSDLIYCHILSIGGRVGDTGNQGGLTYDIEAGQEHPHLITPGQTGFLVAVGVLDEDVQNGPTFAAHTVLSWDRRKACIEHSR
jgi:hypothetical protein